MKSVRSISVLLLAVGLPLVPRGALDPKAAWAAAVKPDWQAQWENTIQAAKKEGQVTVYSTSGASLRLEPFQRQFPEIRYVNFNYPTGGQIVTQKVMNERRAGKYLVDVVISGANTNYQGFHGAKLLEPIRSALILPEVTDRSKWWRGQHWYVDPEGEYVFVYFGNVARLASHNTKLVKPGEFKSYWDFLNPKWRGKIVARDIRRPGSGGDAMRFFYHNPELGPTFLRRLFGEGEIAFSPDNSQGINWLAVGKYSLGLFFGDVDVAKAQGLPVDELDPHPFKEGAPLGVGSGTISLMNRAPHPNAARLFVNWYLSREGQMTTQKDAARGGSGTDSMRIDIPKDEVPVNYRRRETGNYLFVARPELSDTRPINRLVNEALAEAAKGK
jgi:iron(III) transport system substrate-binding protein